MLHEQTLRFPPGHVLYLAPAISQWQRSPGILLHERWTQGPYAFSGEARIGSLDLPEVRLHGLPSRFISAHLPHSEFDLTTCTISIVLTTSSPTCLGTKPACLVLMQMPLWALMMLTEATILSLMEHLASATGQKEVLCSLSGAGRGGKPFATRWPHRHHTAPTPPRTACGPLPLADKLTSSQFHAIQFTSALA